MSALSFPMLATFTAIVLLYTNAPAIAIQRGIPPVAAGAVVPFILLLAVVHQIVIRRRSIVVDRTLCVMLVFLGVLLLSAFNAKGYHAAAARIALFCGEGIAIYFLVRNAVRTPSELRAAIVSVLLAGGILAMVAMVQWLTGAYQNDFLGLAQRAVEHPDRRAGGPVNEPNRFAQILLVAAPLGWVLWIDALRKHRRLLAGLSVALLLGGVLLTRSRGAFLILVVLLVLAAALRLVRPRRLLVALTAGALLIPVVAPSYLARIGSIAGVVGLVGGRGTEPDPAMRGRVTEMLSAFAAFSDHPVLGVGPGQYMPYYSVRYQALPEISLRELPTPRRAHDLYLEIAAETGLVGLVVFLTIPLLLLRDLEVLRRDLSGPRPDLARLAAGFTLALLAYLGTGVFLHLAFERYYWFLVALTAAAVGIMDREDRLELVPAVSHFRQPRQGRRSSLEGASC